MSSSFDFPVLAAPAPVAETAAAERREVAAAAHAVALADARAAGVAEGAAAARAELRPAVEALAAAACELDAERERALAAVERAAAELALDLADKVLGTALELRPELVVDVVRGALRRLVEQREATVLVNPEDLEQVREAVDGLGAEVGATLRLRAERRVGRGGCVLSTPAGEIDARIGEQLARAKEIVTAELSA
jgi:flagellar biosynthesis/type III secretory pathway protein FliH